MKYDKKRTNSFLNIADITSLSQPEVESIMPNVFIVFEKWTY